MKKLIYLTKQFRRISSSIAMFFFFFSLKICQIVRFLLCSKNICIFRKARCDKLNNNFAMYNFVDFTSNFQKKNYQDIIFFQQYFVVKN